jgi:hypothetical protein
VQDAASLPSSLVSSTTLILNEFKWNTKWYFFAAYVGC